jgi:hypothetical protein
MRERNEQRLVALVIALVIHLKLLDEADQVALQHTH